MKARKLKWYGVLFALFVLFLYIMGTYDLFMMLSHNEAYYLSKGYGQAVQDYFTDYPLVGLILWVVNLLSGLTSPLFYLLKNELASKVAFVSGFSDLLLILYGVVFRNRFAVAGCVIIVSLRPFIMQFYSDKLTATAVAYLGSMMFMTTYRMIGEGVNTCLICGCFR